MSRLRRGLLFTAAAVALAACEHKAAEPPPGGIPPLPGGAAPSAAAPGAVHPPTGANAGAGDPSLPPGHPQLPAGHPAVAGDPQMTGEMPRGEYDPKATLVGQLAVADAVKAKVASGDVIFLVARQDDGSDKGPILGVKRLTAGAWPQSFELDGRDAMSPGTKFAGKVLLTARVDKDGDAITKNPGDVVGVAHLEVPAKGFTLTLDKVAE